MRRRRYHGPGKSSFPPAVRRARVGRRPRRHPARHRRGSARCSTEGTQHAQQSRDASGPLSCPTVACRARYAGLVTASRTRFRSQWAPPASGFPSRAHAAAAIVPSGCGGSGVIGGLRRLWRLSAVGVRVRVTVTGVAPCVSRQASPQLGKRPPDGRRAGEEGDSDREAVCCGAVFAAGRLGHWPTSSYAPRIRAASCSASTNRPLPSGTCAQCTPGSLAHSGAGTAT